MLIRITGLTSNNISTDLGLVTLGVTLTGDLPPDQVYQLAKNLATPVARGQISIVVDDDPNAATAVEVPVGPSSSGGGVTVIQSGGTLSGTYVGDVFVDGDATVVGTTVILGSLISTGNLSTVGNQAFTVSRDWVANQVNFYDQAAADSGVSSSGDLPTVTIGGDFIFESCDAANTSTGNRLWRVNGNMIGSNGVDGTEFIASGVTVNAQGTDVRVYGHISGVILMDLSGNATGSGGDLYCDGNVIIESFIGAGGTIEDASGPAGNGSEITVAGNFIGSINVSGGASNGGSGGIGPNISIGGDFIGSQLFARGGDCSSPNSIDSAAGGSSVTILGDVKDGTTVDISGGSRTGSTDSNQSGSGANGGSLLVGGDLYGTTISSCGGSINMDAGVPTTNAGSGGEIEVFGNCVTIEICMAGGSTNVATIEGGLGGVFEIGGWTSSQLIQLSGGDGGAGASNGAGGSALLMSGCAIVQAAMNDGAGDGATDPTSNTQLLMGGFCQFESIEMSDRDQTMISGDGDGIPQTTLRVMSMDGDKKTLDDLGNVHTVDITTNITTTIFYFSPEDGDNGTWTKVVTEALS